MHKANSLVKFQILFTFARLRFKVSPSLFKRKELNAQVAKLVDALL